MSADEIKWIVEGMRFSKAAQRCQLCVIPCDGKDACMYDVVADLIEELAAKVPQWIDVREQPPEKKQRVLFVPTSKDRVCAGSYHGEGKCGGHYFENGNRLETARWWMPLPEPQKE